MSSKHDDDANFILSTSKSKTSKQDKESFNFNIFTPKYLE